MEQYIESDDGQVSSIQAYYREGLQKFELNDHSQLQQEIKDVENQIQKFKIEEKKKKQEQKQNDLYELEFLNCVFYLLNYLNANLEDNYVLKENINFYQLMQDTLKKGLNYHNIQQPSQIVLEINVIEEEKVKISNNENDQQQQEYQQKLNQLKILFIISQNLETMIDQTSKKLKDLEQKLQQGLDEQEIMDAQFLKKEIIDKVAEIQKLKDEKKVKRAMERVKSLEKLKNLEAIYFEIQNLSNNTDNNQKDNPTQPQQIADNQNNLSINESSKSFNEPFEEKKVNSTQKQHEQKNSLLSELKTDKRQNSNNSILTDNRFMPDNQQSFNQSFDLEQNRLLNQHIIKLIDQLDLIDEEISSLPKCSEKYLLSIIKKALEQINEEQEQNEQPASKKEVLTQYLLEQLNCFQQNFNKELNSKKLNELLKTIHKNINQFNLESIALDTEKLLKLVRPFNIRELTRLVKKSTEAAGLIKDQDVVLLIGGTGSGKSTTIHLLAGSKMIEIRQQILPGEYLPYIGPDPNFIKNKDLQNIKIGFSAESETRYITPVTVNFKDIGIHQEGDFILVDTPGQGDTSGAEVDIANGLGIIEGIKHCKSVRPVILISFKSVGDKGEGIKRLAHTLVGFVKEIQDKISSFTYFFTKYPSNHPINQELINIKNSVLNSSEEGSDEAFIALFEDMIDQTKNNTIIIDPINNQPQDIIKLLLRKKAITNPEDVFTTSINEASRNTLQQQINIHYQTIKDATTRGDYEVIEYKLNEIKYLLDLLNEVFIKQIYNQSIDFIIEDLNRDYTETTKSFNRQLVTHINLNEECIHLYKKCVEKFENVENLRSTHLGSKVVQKDSLIQNLVNQINQIIERIEEESDISLKITLHNIQQIAHNFIETQPQYEKICSKLIEKFNNLIVNANEYLKQNDFGELVVVLYAIKQLVSLMQIHQMGIKLEQEYDKFTESVINHLDEICCQVDSILFKEMLDDNDITKLKTFFQIIENAKETTELKIYINFEKLKVMQRNQNDKLIIYFGQVNEKIIDNFKSNNEYQFQKLEELVKQLDMIRTIGTVELQTSKLYYKTIQEIHGYMERQRNEAENILNSLSQNQEIYNYNKIFECLKWLQNAQWMEKVKSGTYTDIMKKLVDILIKHSLCLQGRLFEIHLDINNFNNIKIAYQIIKQAESMRQLEQFIPNLDKELNSIKNEFVKQIKRVCNIIFIKFSFAFSPDQYLKEEGFENIQTLLLELDNSINFIKIKEQHIEIKKQQLNKYSEAKNQLDLIIIKGKKQLKEQKQILKKVNLENITDLQLIFKNQEETVRQLEQDEKFLQQKMERERLQNIQRTYDNLSSQQNQKQSFQTLDGNYSENAILFLEACNHIKLVKDVSFEAQQNLIRYLNSYGEWIQAEIRKNFSFIFDQKSREFNDIICSVQKIVIFYIEINELEQQQYKFTYQFIKGKQIIEEGKVVLKENFISLSSKMNEDSIQQKLLIVRALSKLDFILGDKSYSDLYEKMQQELFKESKEIYQTIIELTKNYDYQMISIELLGLDIINVSEKILGKILHIIIGSIIELIEKTRAQSITLSNKKDLDLISSINSNLTRLDNAQSKILDYYTKGNQEKLKINKFFQDHTVQIKQKIKQIKQIISENIKNSIKGIMARMKTYEFQEAEELRKYIVNAYQLIGNQLINKQIQEDIDNLERNLEKEVETIISDYDKKNIEDFIVNPPKQIQEGLKKIIHLSKEYEKQYKIFQSLISMKIKNQIDKAQNQEWDQKNIIVLSIEKILPYINEEMSSGIKLELELMKQSISKEENDCEEDVKHNIKSANVEQISQLIQKYEDKKMYKIVNKGKQEIINQVKEQKNELQNCLQKEDLRSAITISQKLKEFNQYFGQHVKEIETSFIECQDLLNNKFTKLSVYLNTIAAVEDNKEYVKQFEFFIVFIDFCNEQQYNSPNPTLQNSQQKNVPQNNTSQTNNRQNNTSTKNQGIFEFKNLQDQISQLFERIYNYFLDNQQKFDQAISSKVYQFQQINYCLVQLQKWNVLYLKIQNIQEQQKEIKIPIKYLEGFAEKINTYQKQVQHLKKVIEDLKKEILSFKFTGKYADERQQIYQQMEINLNAIQNTSYVKDHFDENFNLIAFEEECIMHINTYLQQSKVDSINIISYNNILSNSQLDKLRLIYENNLSFEKNVPFYRVQAVIQHSKQELKLQIEQKVEQLRKKIQNTQEINQIGEYLIQMKQFPANIPSLKKDLDSIIDRSLKEFVTKNKAQVGKALSILFTILESDPNGIGKMIITEHQCFQGQRISIFNQQALKHDINYIIDKLQGDQINKKEIKQHYTKFREEYDKLIKESIIKIEKKQINLPELINVFISNIKIITQPIRERQKQEKIVWDYKIRNQITTILAQIFSIWTLKNYSYFQNMKGQENQDSFLMQPHAGQIVSILLLLNIGFENKKSGDQLKNQLVQICTGEGKSITLAVTASILALHGMEVSCACYSQYLSLRDYNYFLEIFDSLQVTQYIKYGTFNQICENFINDQGDIRQRTTNLLFNQSDKEENNKNQIQRPKILLIDEADVFFSEEYYGSNYTPLTCLKDPCITNLTNYIWENRKFLEKLREIEESKQFKDCCILFKGWEELIKESVKNMIADVIDFNHEYIVQNDKIAYKGNDGISFKVNMGYKTLFAYYHENEKEVISDKSLQEYIFIGISCGNFSYAQIPFEFQCIMGVTGTLNTLSKEEKYIVEELYQIKCKTFIPSVFGINKCIFGKVADVYVENSDDYYKKLRQQIDFRLMNNNKQIRAVLVFFETKEALNKFYESQELASIKEKVQIITEENTSCENEKDLLFKKATTSGQITFLTKIFGRGTDFICIDQNVKTNSGVHAIQTFFSKKYSEEVQIRGRVARQGDDGSYSLILLDEDLEKFLGTSYKTDIETYRQDKQIYEQLQKSREKLSEELYNGLNQCVKISEEEHKKSKEFLINLNQKNMQSIKQYLIDQNLGRDLVYQENSRIICLMDATGSMGNLLQQVKNTVKQMFERASSILKEKGMREDSFQMQFAVYRDYDQKQEGILQYSSWESQPKNLVTFMESISAKGGRDYEEAIEIGLQHVNIENDLQKITQVILIGDAPAKSKDSIKEYREKHGGEEYWQKSKFKKMTHYKAEAEKLKENGIPVHAFYLAKGDVKRNFQKIASATNGKSQYLNINSPESSEILTNFVTEEILSSIGKQKGNTDELIQAYRSTYVKRYI